MLHFGSFRKRSASIFVNPKYFSCFLVVIFSEVERIRNATAAWRPGLRPVSSWRASKRVQAKTLTLYVAAALLFVIFVNGLGQAATWGNPDDLAFFAGEYTVLLENSKVRVFHASFQYFWPFIEKSRVTAELKGLEKSTNRNPTTPITFRLLTTLAWFVSRHAGLAPAVGVILAFGALLRTKELLAIRRTDIIWRGGHVVRTHIRLGYTKNNREQVASLEPNSLAERALRYLYDWPDCQPFAPMFEILSYEKLYKWIIQFKLHFRIVLHLTPHSLRAGGATNLRLRGFAHAEIADIGRWEHVGTAKSYVDVVFNLLPETISIENRCVPNGESAIEDFLAAPF